MQHSNAPAFTPAPALKANSWAAQASHAGRHTAGALALQLCSDILLNLPVPATSAAPSLQAALPGNAVDNAPCNVQHVTAYRHHA